MSKYVILSLDGGGIKGYVTALVLSQLQTDVQKQTGKDLIKRVDLLAGTSTGGLIALMLATGKQPSELPSMYTSMGSQIFGPDQRNSEGYLQAKWKRPTQAVQKVFPENRPIRALSKAMVITNFAIRDVSPGNPAWGPNIITNLPIPPTAKANATQELFIVQDSAPTIWDAALGTSAAETFFPSYGKYVDGGTYANNPCAVALGAAIAAGHALDDIRIVSLGTGAVLNNVDRAFGDNLDWGMLQWATYFQSLMMDASMGAADFVCRHVLSESKYCRANPALKKNVPMDDISPATMRILLDSANDFIASPAWGSFVAKVAQYVS
jgi:patatin-like phospholipase/acyl hydrolase